MSDYPANCRIRYPQPQETWTNAVGMIARIQRMFICAEETVVGYHGQLMLIETGKEGVTPWECVHQHAERKDAEECAAENAIIIAFHVWDFSQWGYSNHE